MNADANFDAALAEIGRHGSELDNGFINHAPMVAEALVRLDRGDAVKPWLARYQRQAMPRRARSAPIPANGWHASLGDPKREADWEDRFTAEIARDGWRAVVARWSADLAPGFGGGAAHGVIRVGHAVRALAAVETPTRQAELAAALAMWAVHWQQVAGDPLAETGRLAAHAALTRVPLVPKEQRRNDGAITVALSAIEGLPGFQAALVALDRSGPAEALALSLARAFAANFLQQVHAPLPAIVFTHAITGVAAVRNLAPWLDAATVGTLLAHAWQFGCALHAAYAAAPHDPHGDADSGPHDVEAEIDAAVTHGDDHVIKLTEACVCLHAATGDRLYLAVPARARAVIPPMTR